MTDRTVRVRLEAVTGAYQAKLAAAAASTKTFGSTVTRATGQSRQSFDALGLGLLGFGAAVVGGLGVANKASIDFESSFAGVRKTVSGTPAQLDELAKGFRELATELPVNVNELNRIGESAGQLGIKREAVLGFTEVIAKLGVTTNITGEQAATGLARISNIMKTSQGDFDRMGSTIVALGNAGASTESEIVDMSLGIAGAANIIGLSESDVLAFANAFSSVGIEAEAGGSSFSRVMLDIGEAVDTGGDKLEGFASVAGMSASDFQQAFQEDAAGAIVTFIEGLGRINESGGNVAGTLRDLGFSEIRVRRMLLSTAGAGDLLRKSLGLGNQAWRDNIALNEEAAKRFGTTESQAQLARNALNDLAITVGDITKPAFEGATDVVRELAIDLNALPEPLKVAGVGIGGLTGLASLAAGGFLLLAPRITATKVALAELGVTANGLARSGGVIGGLLIMLQQLSDLMRDIEEHGTAEGLERRALKLGSQIGKFLPGMSQVSAELQEKLDELNESGEKVGGSLLGLAQTIPLTAAEMTVLAGETNKAATVHELAAEMADKQRLAELSLAGGLVGLMASVQTVATAERELTEARREFIRLTNSGARGTDKWKEAQERYRDAQIGALQANISATDAIGDYGKELADAGVPQRRVIGLVREFGERAGLSKGEIRKLIDEVQEHIRTLGRIPKTKHTKVTADTGPATTEIRQFMDRLSDAQVEVVVRGRLARGGVLHSGGWVPGAGDIPITAQAGEFVVNRKMARENAAMLEALNAGRVYHDGGWIGHPRVDFQLAQLAKSIEQAKKSFLGGNIVEIGRQLQGMGFTITGHSQFPPIGGHVQGSYHYLDRALDINKGAGTSPAETAAINRIWPMLLALPHVEALWQTTGHYDHAHYAMQSGALFGRPTSGFFTAGEREPEIVSPVSMLRQIVREEVRRISVGIPGITGGFKDLDRLEGRLRRIIENISSSIEEGLEGAVRRAKKAAIKELTSMLNEITRRVERAQRRFDRLKEEAQELRSSVVQSIGGLADLSGFEGTTRAELETFLSDQVKQAELLAKLIRELSKQGRHPALDPAALAQILSMGAAGIPLAQMLVSNRDLVGDVNRAFGDIADAAKDTGKFVQGKYFGKDLREAGREVRLLTKEFNAVTRAVERFRRQIEEAVERQERQERREERREERQERREERREERGDDKKNGKANGKGTKLAGGGYFTRPFTGFVSMAESSPEIVAPERVLRQILREEPRGQQPVIVQIVPKRGMEGIERFIDVRIQRNVMPAIERAVRMH